MKIIYDCQGFDVSAVIFRWSEFKLQTSSISTNVFENQNSKKKRRNSFKNVFQASYFDIYSVLVPVSCPKALFHLESYSLFRSTVVVVDGAGLKSISFLYLIGLF